MNLNGFFFDFCSIWEPNLEPCWPLFWGKKGVRSPRLFLLLLGLVFFCGFWDSGSLLGVSGLDLRGSGFHFGGFWGRFGAVRVFIFDVFGVYWSHNFGFLLFIFFSNLSFRLKQLFASFFIFVAILKANLTIDHAYFLVAPGRRHSQIDTLICRFLTTLPVLLFSYIIVFQ